MKAQIIPVTSGVGTGKTKLAAFDAALFDAGVANYNLIHLSSIVPPGFAPSIQPIKLNDKEFGNRLYVVYSSRTAVEIGEQAWAGLGWVMTDEKVKRGLFVEQAGGSREEVEAAIKRSLESMMSYRKNKFGKIQQLVAGITCKGEPVCSLVIAVYKSENW